MQSLTDEKHKWIGIPKGEYCYQVLKTPFWDISMPTRYLKWCPFWYGRRPDGGCMIYGWDAGLGDACKACDWLRED